MGKNRFTALLLDNGQLISINKKANENSKVFPDSNGAPDEEWGQQYSTGRVAKPPYNPRHLAELLESNTYHDRCVKQKAADVVGLGFDFEEEEKGDTDKSQNPKYKLIKEFFENCHPQMTFNEIMNQAWIDYESIGWMVIEVLRTVGGDKKVARLEHIPAATCRVSMDDDKPGIIQRRGISERYFKFFGDTEERIDPNTGKPASEVLYLMQYHPKSDYYGIPDYIAAVGAIVANMEIRDFNIEFFENNAIPDYAVVLTGGEPDEAFEKTVKDYFANNLKGKDKRHKTVILSAPSGGEIKFEPLGTEIKDGHFRLYRIDCRDEIIHSHGVPPYRIGIAETGSLGGSTAQEANKIYKSSIVTPKQEKIENRLTKLIKFGLGIEGWKFKFNEIDLTDKKIEADIAKVKAETAKIVTETGLLTIDEARYEHLDMERFKDMEDIDEEIIEWANKPLTFVSPQEAQSMDPNITPPSAETSDPNFDKDFEKQWNEEMKLQGLTNITKYLPRENRGVVQKITKAIKKTLKGKKKKLDIFAEQEKLYIKMKDSLTNYFLDISKKVVNSLENTDLEKLFPTNKIQKSLTIEQAEQIASMYPEAFTHFSSFMNYMDVASLIFVLMQEGVNIGKMTAISELDASAGYIDWKLYDERASKFLDNYVFKASKTTMDRLVGDVLLEIKKSLEAGESIPQLQDKLTNVFINMANYETERIARTESSKSLNWARYQAFSDAGKKFKIWVTSIDGRERDSHRSINGEIKPMNEVFSNKLMYPGDPAGIIKEVVNCRCTIRWTDNEQGEELE